MYPASATGEPVTSRFDFRAKTSSRASWRSSGRRSSIQGEEGADEPQWSRAGVERVVDQASTQELQASLRRVIESAARNGLYPRPSKRSIMLAPGANRSRALITLNIRDDGRLDRWLSPEAFQAFYGFSDAEVERQLGAPEWATYEPEEVAALADRLDELMAEVAAT